MPIRAVRVVLPLVVVAVLLCIGSSSGVPEEPAARTAQRAVPTTTVPATTPTTAGTPTTGTTTTGTTTGQPQGHIMLGAYVSLHNYPDDEKAIEQREQAAGRQLDIQLTYYNWNDQFPDFGEATIAAHGRTPLMSWYGPGKDPWDTRTLAEINNGQDDGWIKQQARAIKAFGRLIYLSPIPEMNGTWYRGFSGNPTAYVAAWQRIHDLFAQVGVPNVKWMWRPNITPAVWDPYYPGDAYVDVIAVDGYNNGHPWRSFQGIFDTFLAHYAGRKPLMIGETATQSANGNSAEWINAMHTYLETVAGPRYGVVGLCWFDTDTDDNYDWRVDQTPQAWAAWLSLARDPYFGGHG